VQWIDAGAGGYAGGGGGRVAAQGQTADGAGKYPNKAVPGVVPFPPRVSNGGIVGPLAREITDACGKLVGGCFAYRYTSPARAYAGFAIVHGLAAQISFFQLPELTRCGLMLHRNIAGVAGVATD